MSARLPGPQAPAAPATRPDSPQRKPQRAIAATTPVTSRLGEPLPTCRCPVTRQMPLADVKNSSR